LCFLPNCVLQSDTKCYRVIERSLLSAIIALPLANIMSLAFHSIPRSDLAFVPLKLPKTGEELLEGRQYEIDPVARAVIFDKFGIRPPKFVECIHSKSCQRTVTSVTTYADGRPSVTSVMEIPGRQETFRAFYKYKRVAVFQCDLAVVEDLRQFYVDAPIVAEDEPEERERSPREKAATSVAKDKAFKDLLASLDSL